MRIRVNRVHHPVTALGPGKRAGVWLQGCTIGCPGCMSRDTWSPQAGRLASVAALIGWLQTVAGDVDGVTISGGEPFDQPQALAELLRAIHSWRVGAGRAIDVLCFSGYSLARLRRRHAEALELVDAAITGPFRQDLPTRLIWRGSANQVLTALTPLGRERYAPYVRLEPAEPALQVTVDDEAVRFIGVPRHGDLARLEERLLATGVSLGRASWRP